MGAREAHGSRQRGPRAVSARFGALAASSRRELEQVMRAGAPVAPIEMAGSEWRGWNIAPLTAPLGVRKFLKRIHPPDEDGRVWGENVLARPGGLESAWRPAVGGRGFLPFGVLGPPAGAPDGWPAALVIAYGAWPPRPAWSPVSRVVDYLVRPFAERPDLLLGVSYLKLVRRRLFLEHFLLERSP